MTKLSKHQRVLVRVKIRRAHVAAMGHARLMGVDTYTLSFFAAKTQGNVIALNKIARMRK